MTFDDDGRFAAFLDDPEAVKATLGLALQRVKAAEAAGAPHDELVRLALVGAGLLLAADLHDALKWAADHPDDLETQALIDRTRALLQRHFGQAHGSG